MEIESFDLDADFSAEPTDDLLAETLNTGLADGTLVLSDSDFEDESGSEVERKYSFLSIMSSRLTGFSAVGPVTSTPFVRKTAAPKGRKTIGKHNIKVDIHDGVAMRKVPVSTSDSRLDLLEKVSTAMKRPNSMVELGYEAPWSAKINNKKCVAYISNEEELDDFWLALARHMAAQKKKLKGKSEVADPGIVFHNILDSAQASQMNFEYVRVLISLRI